MDMDINSPEFAQALNKIIEEKVQKIVKEELNKYGIMKGFPAKVSSVNGDSTINVTLASDPTTIIPNLKNKSGVALVANDEVFLYSISSLTNSYVGCCKNKP